MATLPNLDGESITVQLGADYSWRSTTNGEFDSGRYRIYTAAGAHAAWGEGVGIGVGDAADYTSGSYVKVKFAGTSFVRTGMILSGGDYVVASGAGLGYKGTPLSGAVLIGQVTGPTTDVYSVSGLAPVRLFVYTEGS